MPPTANDKQILNHNDEEALLLSILYYLCSYSWLCEMHSLFSVSLFGGIVKI